MTASCFSYPGGLSVAVRIMKYIVGEVRLLYQTCHLRCNPTPAANILNTSGHSHFILCIISFMVQYGGELFIANVYKASPIPTVIC